MKIRISTHLFNVFIEKRESRFVRKKRYSNKAANLKKNEEKKKTLCGTVKQNLNDSTFCSLLRIPYFVQLLLYIFQQRKGNAD